MSTETGDVLEPAEPQAPHYIVQRVRRALALDPRTNELDIHVAVAGDKVFLTGTVPNEERRQSIGDVAAEALAGHQISNQVSVYEIAPPGEGEKLS